MRNLHITFGDYDHYSIKSRNGFVFAFFLFLLLLSSDVAVILEGTAVDYMVNELCNSPVSCDCTCCKESSSLSMQ